MWPEHIRYIGVLSLLAQCAVHVPEDLRDCIDSALDDAQSAMPDLVVNRFIHGRDIEFRQQAADTVRSA